MKHLIENPFWPASGPRKTGLMSEEEGVRHLEWFCRGESFFDVDVGAFMCCRDQQSDRFRVLITPQMRKPKTKWVGRDEVMEYIRLYKWVLEDGEYDPGGFGEYWDFKIRVITIAGTAVEGRTK